MHANKMHRHTHTLLVDTGIAKKTVNTHTHTQLTPHLNTLHCQYYVCSSTTFVIVTDFGIAQPLTTSQKQKTGERKLILKTKPLFHFTRIVDVGLERGREGRGLRERERDDREGDRESETDKTRAKERTHDSRRIMTQAMNMLEPDI